ncbi:hypothetical protein D3227_39825 [Mesorhizobium waimense]|uniref:Uncharacterized protein n=1 Tax=Mesorhizobium waimense TaxID=1300307 RepID=A0A3A5JQ32_9HYPH|nr:hypothetical protein D3227_39825 [Mesorhizobium waimense]
MRPLPFAGNDLPQLRPGDSATAARTAPVLPAARVCARRGDVISAAAGDAWLMRSGPDDIGLGTIK